MNAQDIIESADFQKCLDFHGHLCPGLSLGFRAAKAGLEWLAENRSEDEEVVAVVGNDACGTDAVQVLTGCTFGKGNFVYKDYGKHVFLFHSRGSGRAVRVALRPGAMEPDAAHRALGAKVRNGQATPEEAEEYRNAHIQRSHRVLTMPLDELFDVREVDAPPPPKAVIHESVTCARCGEPTMKTRIKDVDGQSVCLECLES